MRKSLLGATALAGAAGLMSGPAFAQNATAKSEAPSVAEVVVTGSRITRNDYVAESPIVTVGQGAIQAQGPGTVEATLNQMPQFTALRAGSGFTDAARGGRNNANMRGLGISRTLVLLDGRRLQPSDSLGAIDLNTVPTEMIENVEVISGGASATYGSDAIAGVVNFKLKRDFEGLLVDAQYGVTGEGDAASKQVSITGGGRFANDRGRAVLSLSYLDRDFAPRSDRSYFINSGIASNLAGGIFQADPANLPTQAALNSLFLGRYGGTTPPVRSQGLAINADGSLFTPGAPVLNYKYGDHDPYVLVNGRVGTPYGESQPLQTPLERYSVFFRTSYDLTEDLNAYAQVQYVDYNTTYSRPGYAIREPVIPVTNPFVPADLRTILASRPNPNAPIIYNFSAGRFGPDVYTNDYTLSQIVVGLNGKAIRDWTWDVYGSFGRTKAEERASLRLDRTAMTNLVNAPDGGRSLCAGGFNPFTAAPVSAQCVNYLVRPILNSTEFGQQVVEGTLQGGLLDLPGGQLRFAAGADYRRNTYDSRPDAQLVAGTLLNFPAGQVAPVSASVEVKELFGELLVPVLKDLPLAKSVSLDLAYRVSDYSSIGRVATYKATGDWALTDWLRLRGGYQRAIRAPSLGELYPNPGGGQGLISSTASGQGDPCDVTGLLRRSAAAAQVRALCIASGVPASVVDIFRFNGSTVQTRAPFSAALTEETADTYTAGVVFRSPVDHPLLSRASLSLDYYSIDVKNAVGFITAPVVLSGCFNTNGASNPSYSATNSYCQLIVRDQTGAISEVLTPQLNLAAYRTSGVDLQFDDSFDLADLGLPDGWGSLRLNLVVSYLAHYEIQNLAGQPFTDYAGTIGNAQIDAFTISYPKWKATASASWRLEPVELTLAGRWSDSMYNSQDAGSASHTRAGVDSRIYLDLTGRVRLPDQFEVRGGVLNLADTQPPVWTGEGATDPALFDILGRRLFVGVSKRF
jgi:iron complex outermembrane receptor protein